MDISSTSTRDFDSMWDYNDPCNTELAFRQLLSSEDSRHGDSYTVELLTQIARTEGLQRKFDDAHRTLGEAEALLPEANERARIRYVLEKGRVFNSSGNHERATECFLMAFELAQEAGEDFYAVDAAHMMAIVEPPSSGLQWNLRAQELASSSDDPRARGWMGSLYNNTGWAYHNLGHFQDALSIFQKGLEWQQQMGKLREARIAAWTVARTLRSLGRVEEALQMQWENLQRQRDEWDDPDGYIQEEIGECLLILGREDDAREHFARAHSVLSQDIWLQSNEPDRLERLARLGA